MGQDKETDIKFMVQKMALIFLKVFRFDSDDGYLFAIEAALAWLLVPKLFFLRALCLLFLCLLGSQLAF